MADGAENTNTNVKPEKVKSKEKKKSKDQKLSVLETHGYTVGRSVGTGSYATVKVINCIIHIIVSIKLSANTIHNENCLFKIIIDKKNIQYNSF